MLTAIDVTSHGLLDEATEIIGQFWQRKNAKRHGLPSG